MSSLKDLAINLARQMGDELEITATGGSTSAVFNSNFIMPTDHYAGAWAYRYNDMDEARISASRASDGAIVVHPAWPTAVSATERIEIFRKHRYADYRQAIRDAEEEGSESFWQPWLISTATTNNLYAYSVSYGAGQITDVQVQAVSTYDTYPFRKPKWEERKDVASRVIQFFDYPPAGYALRIEGIRDAIKMDAADDTPDVPDEKVSGYEAYLQAAGEAHLLRRGLAGGTGDGFRATLTLMEQADQRAQRILRRHGMQRPARRALISRSRPSRIQAAVTYSG
jgi:hypothetical protein